MQHLLCLSGQLTLLIHLTFIEHFDTTINRLIKKRNQQFNDLSASWYTMIQTEKVALGEHFVGIPIYRPVFGRENFKYTYLNDSQ